MNHLHWPRALRHSDDAIADFRRCLELQEGAPPRAYHERTYVLLGDALAKNKAYDEARRAWSAGRVGFPDSVELSARLAVRGDDQLLALVEERRTLEQPIDTDFSFLDVP
jgi:hypothetical protein